jgi:divalent metal cation (Fe/Co/Zn/Cd) transporter
MSSTSDNLTPSEPPPANSAVGVRGTVRFPPGNAGFGYIARMNLPIVEKVKASTPPIPDRISRPADLQSAILLTYLTLGWMTIEGGSSLILGWFSKSLLLEAFGLDSAIELLSAGVLLWRLKVEVGGQADEARIEFVERRAAWLMGHMLYGLALFVTLNSAYGLFITHRITDTHESVWGIFIGLTAKIGMPILAGYKLKVAARLNSRALRADAMESITCGYLAIVLMIGLVATRLFDWWWLDSVAALVLIPFLVKEGRAAIRGESCCCASTGCKT